MEVKSNTIELMPVIDFGLQQYSFTYNFDDR